jgi:hypothetical protein
VFCPAGPGAVSFPPPGKIPVRAKKKTITLRVIFFITNSFKISRRLTGRFI